MNGQTPTPLTQLPVPSLLRSQLNKFNVETTRTHKLFEFDPESATDVLKDIENKRVIGIDLGGNKAVTILYRVENGALVIDDSFSEYAEGDDGKGFLPSFERVSEFTSKNNIPVGISYGAPINGSKPRVDWPKFKIFLDEFNRAYQADFANLFPTIGKVLNDAPAGLISGATQAHRTLGSTEILYVINGSGMNTAALKDGRIHESESGHVESVQELNVFNQTEPCKVDDATYVCLESLGANKFGIESQWELKTNEHLTAKEIEDRYKAGDRLAAELYDHSALVVAHMIQGSANVFGINLATADAAVVAHGGAFRFPGYKDRIRQILEKHTQAKIQLFRTEDYSQNACAEGASIAALVLPAASSAAAESAA